MSKTKLYIISANLVLVLGFFLFNVAKNEKVLDSGEIVLLELRPADPRSIMQGDYMTLRFSVGDDVKYAKNRSVIDQDAREIIVDTLTENEVVENTVDTLIANAEESEQVSSENDDDNIEAEHVAPAQFDSNEEVDFSTYDYNEYKYCVVHLDKDRVASFVRVTNHKDELLENDEMLLRYAEGKSKWEQYVYFGADSYFFQEGTGSKYARAKYGMLKVVTEGGMKGTCILVGLCGEDKQLIK